LANSTSHQSEEIIRIPAIERFKKLVFEFGDKLNTPNMGDLTEKEVDTKLYMIFKALEVALKLNPYFFSQLEFYFKEKILVHREFQTEEVYRQLISICEEFSPQLDDHFIKYAEKIAYLETYEREA
jgi:hypothetical protein